MSADAIFAAEQALFATQDKIAEKKQKQKEQEKSILIEGKAIDDESERQAATRFQEQCHLMLKWEEFTSMNVDPEAAANFQTRPAYYKNFGIIDHDTPFDLINRLFNKGPDSDILFNLTAEQLSVLVPQVRIFKIYVDPLTKEEFTIELPFDDHMSRHEVSKITSTRAGRGAGVGLNSFSWRTEGRTPANQFQFAANMKLHFQSIEDLFSVRDTTTVQFATSQKTIDVRFSDLLIPQRSFRNGPNTGPGVWDLDYFKIKAVVGWKVPNFRNVNSFIPEAARDVLARTYNSFILAIFDHDIDIRDDGTVDISIDFNTMPELTASDPLNSNILFPSAQTKNEIERLIAKINKYTFEIENQTIIGPIRDEVNEQSKDIEDGQSGVLYEAAVEARKKVLDDALKALALFDNSKKSQSYKRILSGLYLKKALRYTFVGKDFIDKRVKMTNRDFEGSQEQIDYAVNLITQQKNTEKANSWNMVDSNIQTILSSKETTDENFSEKLDSIQNLDLIGDDVPNNYHKIIYFYFGDLLDVVLEGMFKKGRAKTDTFGNKRLKVLLGSLTFYDYGSLEDHHMVGRQNGVVNEKAGVEKVYTGKLSSVSLADIPISLNVFTSWFNENIVKPGAESFSFKAFIEKAINDLIVVAIKTECYDFAPRHDVKLTYHPFTTPANKKRTQLFKQSTRVDARELEEMPFINEEIKSFSDQVEMEDYMLICASVSHPWDLIGDYDSDRKRGVFHLFFGNERGIVKNIKFKRSDQPYIRSANMAANFNDAKGATKMLRGKYDANIEMVGNNLFVVGSQLKIIPSLGGGSDGIRVIELVEDLGIGGYFQVLDRQDTIEDGSYVTNLTAVWVSQSNKKKGGKVNPGDLENAPNVIRAKKKVKTPQSNGDAANQTEGDISDNVGQ